MAITKDAVLAEVKARTTRTTLADVDDELAAVLLDLSTKWPFLEKSNTVTISAGGHTVALPSEYRRPLRGVTITVTKVKLDKLTFPEFLTRLSADTIEGTPNSFAIFNDSIYVHPIASAETGLTIYHAYETSDVDTIVFSDDFKEAIIEGVCWKVYEGLGQMAEATAAQMHKAFYDEQVEALKIRYADRAEE